MLGVSSRLCLCGGGAGDPPRSVQAAGGEHDFIHEALPPVAEGGGDDVAAFDASDGGFHRHPHPADEMVDRLLDGMKFSSPWLLLRLERLGVWRFVALEADVFDHQGIGRVDQPAHWPTFCRARCTHSLVQGKRRAFHWKTAGSFCGGLSSCHCIFASGRPCPWAGARALYAVEHQ